MPTTTTITDLPKAASPLPLSAAVLIQSGLSPQQTTVGDIVQAVSARNVKPNVRTASTGNVNIAAALITGATMDGVVLAAGDSVLLWKQTNGAENGIYTVATSGAAARRADADTAGELVGTVVYVSTGAANGFKEFALLTAGAITVGTSALTFGITVDQAAVNAAAVQPLVDEAQEAADSIATRAVIGPPTGGGDYAFGIYNEDAGKMVPVMRADGTLVVFDPATGDVEDVVKASDLAGVSLPEGPSPDAGDYALAVWNDGAGKLAPIMDTDGHVVSLSRKGDSVDRTLTEADIADQQNTYTQIAYDSTLAVINHYLLEPDTWIHYMVQGQSNGQGHNLSTDSLPGASPIYPANAWMFRGGPRRSGAGLTDLVPLQETFDSQNRETRCSGFANHLIKLVNDATGKMPNILCSVTCIGARKYTGLKRGSDAYSDFLNAVDNGVTAIRAKGGRKILTIVDFDQAESDNDVTVLTSAQQRTRSMQQFARQTDGDVRARTGETETVMVFMDQVSLLMGGKEWSSWMKQSQVDCDGLHNIRLPGPRYQFPMSDEIHMSSLGQNRCGQQGARAVFAEHFGTGWLPLKPLKWWWASSTSLVLEFRDNVTIDTSDAFVKQSGISNAGFSYTDLSGSPAAINGVTASGKQVTVTWATAPAGFKKRLGYAIFANAGATLAGPVQGPRGLVRGTTPHTSLYDGVDNFDWVPSFFIDI